MSTEAGELQPPSPSHTSRGIDALANATGEERARSHVQRITNQANHLKQLQEQCSRLFALAQDLVDELGDLRDGKDINCDVADVHELAIELRRREGSSSVLLGNLADARVHM